MGLSTGEDGDAQGSSLTESQLLFFTGPKRVLTLLKYSPENGNQLSAIHNRQILEEIHQSSGTSQQVW